MQGHLSVFQTLISFLNNPSHVAFLIETYSQIFGEREDMVSVPKYTDQLHLLFKVEFFLRL